MTLSRKLLREFREAIVKLHIGKVVETVEPVGGLVTSPNLCPWCGRWDVT
jgi:hypothetical protein